MGNSSVLSIVAICLATSATAQPMPQHLDVLQDVVRIDFVFDNVIRQTNDLPTAALRAARRQMISGAYIGASDLRALADAGDGLAAFRYGKLLQESETPDLTGAAAHYYAIAAYTGRDFAVPPLARLLRDEGANFSASRLTHSLNAMTVQALSGNSVAATHLGQMYADGVPFGRDLVQAQAYLGMAPDGGNPRALLQLGMTMMSDAEDAALGHPGARSALTLAAASEDLSVKITAENLLRLIDTMPSPQTEVTQ